MSQKFRFLDNLIERLVKGSVPHQDWDEFRSVWRLHYTLLLRDVEMDDLLFEMFVLQQLPQVLSNETKQNKRAADFHFVAVPLAVIQLLTPTPAKSLQQFSSKDMPAEGSKTI